MCYVSVHVCYFITVQYSKVLYIIFTKVTNILMHSMIKNDTNIILCYLRYCMLA